MATNNVLIAQAIAISLAASIEPPEGMEDLNNAQLAKLVNAMKKDRPDAAAKVVEDERIAAEELANLAKKKARPPYYIAEGKALTTKRGLLGPRREIKAEDLAGGEKALKAFVKTKHVIKS